MEQLQSSIRSGVMEQIRFLKETVLILTRDLAVIHSLSTSFSSGMYVFKEVGFSDAFIQRC